MPTSATTSASFTSASMVSNIRLHSCKQDREIPDWLTEKVHARIFVSAENEACTNGWQQEPI